MPLLVQAVIWISLCIEIHFDSFITSGGACGFTRMNMAYNFVSSLFTEHLQENIAIHHHQKQDLRIMSAFAEHKILLHFTSSSSKSHTSISGCRKLGTTVLSRKILQVVLSRKHDAKVDRYITSGACKFTCMNMAYNFVSSLFIEHLRENVAIHQKQDFRIINAIAEHKIPQHLLPLHYNLPDEENSALLSRKILQVGKQTKSVSCNDTANARKSACVNIRYHSQKMYTYVNKSKVDESTAMSNGYGGRVWKCDRRVSWGVPCDRCVIGHVSSKWTESR